MRFAYGVFICIRLVRKTGADFWRFSTPLLLIASHDLPRGSCRPFSKLLLDRYIATLPFLTLITMSIQQNHHGAIVFYEWHRNPGVMASVPSINSALRRKLYVYVWVYGNYHLREPCATCRVECALLYLTRTHDHAGLLNHECEDSIFPEIGTYPLYKLGWPKSRETKF